MLQRILIGLLAAVPAYFLGAFGSPYMMIWLSPGGHVSSVGGPVSAMFLYGPLAAILGFVVGAALGGPRRM